MEDASEWRQASPADEVTGRVQNHTPSFPITASHPTTTNNNNNNHPITMTSSHPPSYHMLHDTSNGFYRKLDDHHHDDDNDNMYKKKNMAAEEEEKGENVCMVPLSRGGGGGPSPFDPLHDKAITSDSLQAGGGEGGGGGGRGGGDVEGGEGGRGMEEEVEFSMGAEGEGKNLTPLRQLLSLWYVAVIILAPLVLLPFALVLNTPEAKCAYVIFLMAVLWVTEAIPIPVTSLMPIFLLPMLGLVTARKTSAQYINDTSILFLGGLTVAIAIEKWNLHRRIALAVMMLVGSEPRWLMLGMMLTTWFLSMWISNTATTAMMLPIVQAVLQQIGSTEEDRDSVTTQDDPVEEWPSPEAAEDTEESEPSKSSSGRLSRLTNRIRKYRLGSQSRSSDSRVKDGGATQGSEVARGGAGNGERGGRGGKGKGGGGGGQKQMSMTQLGKALSLAVAYSANVGGIASLTGTGPNLVLLGQSQIVFENVGLTTPISFATWMIYGLPLSFILVILVWVWLQIKFLRCRGGCDCIFKANQGPEASARNNRVRDVIRAEFKKLGPVSYAEGTIIVFFALLVILWITRDLGGSGGWALLFQKGMVSDSTPAILVAVLMFVLPSSLPDIFFRSRRQGPGPRRAVTALMDWQTLHQKMPWSLYLLLGGGFAIATAVQDSGLSLWLGEKLSVFGSLDPWLMLFLICYIVTFVTEVTSNTAIATIMMPILAQLSLTLQLNPLFFMFPVAITTSFAFMLPVATPPNAIVFAYGVVRVIDMVLAGFVLNLLCVPILLLATYTWGNAFFHFDVLPPEFLANVTASAAALTTPLP